ncbi:DUF4282 domain-containing protein [Sporosarcina sp. Marseille-Q4063]|uniref:DUF4282 domain-containing protein n=1 Tax=Sporosarcina sp. Marseille-Q4063 TaxID=2810514 RepID=UPI00201635DF|nr:DUF4282 domain-containing protein [Sporosarcina sp. Marseille-Q4063]
MICVNCSHEQASGKFCGKCGTSLQGVETSQVGEITVSQLETETAASNVSESITQPVRNRATPVQPNREGKSWMKEFLHFDKMITTSIIKFVFWIGAGLSILAGLIIMISGFVSEGIFVLLGLLAIVVGPIVVRIYCELLIVFFKIHEALQDLKGSSFNR